LRKDRNIPRIEAINIRWQPKGIADTSPGNDFSRFRPWGVYVRASIGYRKETNPASGHRRST
jgi:hypothetical protein